MMKEPDKQMIKFIYVRSSIWRLLLLTDERDLNIGERIRTCIVIESKGSIVAIYLPIVGANYPTVGRYIRGLEMVKPLKRFHSTTDVYLPYLYIHGSFLVVLSKDFFLKIRFHLN